MQSNAKPSAPFRYLIIANPSSGRGRGARMARAVADVLAAAGAACELRFTSRPGEAEQMASNATSIMPATQEQPGAARPLCTVACGGDGTVQEVANGLMNAPSQASARPLLGLIAAGRCNDFASALGCAVDAEACGRMLLNGRVRSIDLGRVGERYFCTVAAFGFDAAVSRFVHEMRLPITGTPAYVYGVLRVLMRYRSGDTNVRWNGQQRSGPAFMVTCANTATYGGQMHIAPDADVADGQLEVCLVSPMPRRRVLRLLQYAIRGTHVSLPEVEMSRSAMIQIDTGSPREIWADGELVGHTPNRLCAIATAIDVIVPHA